MGTTTSKGKPMKSLLQTFATITLLIMTALPAIADEKRRPNVIFIISDDQEAREFGYLNPGNALTPSLDRMASEGVNFTRGYVAASVCSPSRYTVLSGHYASRCSIEYFTNQATEEGVRRVLWNLGFAEGQPTVQSVLQKAGYRTGFIGKWHINGVGKLPPLPPEGSDPHDPKINALLKQNHDSICEGIKRWGFDEVPAAYRGNPNDDPMLVRTGMNIHNMEWLTKGALDFIEGAAGDKEPFFLYFATTLTHVPDPDASRHIDPRYTGEGVLDEPITGIMPPRETIGERLAAAGIPDKDERGAALWMDDGIGAVMKKLEDLGIAEDTLVIFFNDHGMEGCSKGTCYEGGLITPTLAYWPGTIAPQVCDEFVQNIDFMPTILDAAGVEPPEEAELDGQSWLPLVANNREGEDVEWRDFVYSEIGLTRAITTKDMKYIAFRVPASLERTHAERLAEHKKLYAEMLVKEPWTRSMKLPIDPGARYYQMGMAPGGHRFERQQLMTKPGKKPAAWLPNYFDPDQLYDLSKDPAESTNLADDPAYADELAKMKAKLRGVLETLPDTFETLLD